MTHTDDPDRPSQAPGTPPSPGGAVCPEQVAAAGSGVPVRYPDYLMDFPLELSAQQAQRLQRFLDLREDVLLDYGYHTARAYWADLQDILEWATQRDKDVLALTEKDLTQYRALLRRRKYSEATIRRRMVTWNKMRRRIEEERGEPGIHDA